jgi:hypothetical protein
MPVRTWTMTGDPTAPWLDKLDVGINDVPEMPGDDWALRLQTLRGGLRDGVQVVELNNGPMSLQILPTRGMGIWKGNCHGLPLGWNAPVAGPVHPKFVNVGERGGLGWLAGFDEWLCRCGLVSNGPPGDDNGTPLTLHGRIANTPARRVSLGVDPENSRLFVQGVVEEGGLFLGRLRLTSTIHTQPDSTEFTIHDVVENLSAQRAEMQMLYHLNNGEPLLEAGSQVLVPFREMAPHTAHAAKALDTYDTLRGPTGGFAEEVFDFRPNHADGQTTVLLRNAAGNIGLALSWDVRQLPCFTIWKNTAAREDGFVVGLEPATNFPYFKSHERAKGRVVQLPPGGRWEAEWRVRVCVTAAEVEKTTAAITALQGSAPGTIHRTPTWGPGT